MDAQNDKFLFEATHHYNPPKSAARGPVGGTAPANDSLRLIELAVFADFRVPYAPNRPHARRPDIRMRDTDTDFLNIYSTWFS